MDHLPFLSSGLSVSRRLGVPELVKHKLKLQEWDVSESVATVCFDITVANTGRRTVHNFS